MARRFGAVLGATPRLPVSSLVAGEMISRHGVSVFYIDVPMC